MNDSGTKTLEILLESINQLSSAWSLFYAEDAGLFAKGIFHDYWKIFYASF